MARRIFLTTLPKTVAKRKSFGLTLKAPAISPTPSKKGLGIKDKTKIVTKAFFLNQNSSLPKKCSFFKNPFTTRLVPNPNKNATKSPKADPTPAKSPTKIGLRILPLRKLVARVGRGKKTAALAIKLLMSKPR